MSDLGERVNDLEKREISCRAEVNAEIVRLDHQIEKDRMEEQHSREENEAAHLDLRKGIDKAHRRLDEKDNEIETIQGQLRTLNGTDDQKTVERVKALKRYVIQGIGTIILSIALVIITWLLSRGGIH